MASKIVEVEKNTNFEVENAWPVSDSVSLWRPLPEIPTPYPFLCFLLANDTLWGICAGRPVYGSFLCIMSSFCSCSVFFQAYPPLLSMTLSPINLPSDSCRYRTQGHAHGHLLSGVAGRSSNADALMHRVKHSPCFHKPPVIPLGFHVGTMVN